MNKFLSRRTNADSNEDSSNGFRVTLNQIPRNFWNIYLFGPIESHDQITDALECFQSAGPHDVVQIFLSTPGGDLDVTDTFVDGMRSCVAHVKVNASGSVMSAGTIILMNADEFELSENFNALLHNGSCGSGGKFSDWRKQAKHTEAYMEKVLRQTYAGFLDALELDELLEGRDLWLDGNGWCERWERRQEYLASLCEGCGNDPCQCPEEDTCASFTGVIDGSGNFAVGLTD